MESVCNIACDVVELFKKVLHFFKSVGIMNRCIFDCSEIIYDPSFDKYLDSFIEYLEEIKDVLDKLYVERTKQALNNEATLFIENTSCGTNSNSVHTTPSHVERNQDCRLLSRCQITTDAQLEGSSYLLDSELSSSQKQDGRDAEVLTSSSILELNMSEFLQEPRIVKQIGTERNMNTPGQDDCLLDDDGDIESFSIMDPTNKPLSELIESISQSNHNSQFKETTDNQILKDQSILNHTSLTVDGPTDILLSADVSQNAVNRPLDCLSDSETHLVSPDNQLTKALDQLLQPCTPLTLETQKLDMFTDKCDRTSGFLLYVQNYGTDVQGKTDKSTDIFSEQDLNMGISGEVEVDSHQNIDHELANTKESHNSWNEICSKSTAGSTKGKKRKFQCPTCNKIVSSKRNLHNHMRIHTGRKLFCCEHCGKLFTTKPNLRAHLTRQHNLNLETALSCSECGKLFTRKSALDTHLAGHRGIKPFSCFACGKSFTQKITRDIHALTHTGKYEYACNVCHKRFATQSRLNFHMKSHGDPEFACSLCSKKFSNKQYLNKHYETHNVTHTQVTQCLLETVPDKPTTQVHSEELYCGQCDLTFRSKRGLTKHRKSKHSTTGPRFHCNVLDCQAEVKSFTNKQYLIRHNERHHNPNRERYSCNTCGADFADQSSLTHHEYMKHSGVPAPLHTCPMCSKAFTLKSKLKVHMKTHTEEPHLPCEVCGKRYYRSDNLKKHMLSHTSTGVTCTVCGKRLLYSSSLQNHMKKHNGSGHTCTQCGKTFTTKTALDYHCDKHNEKFRFSCDTCGKQFVRKIHYESHLKMHSTERPFKCSTCGRSFKEQKHWKEHMKRVHGNQFPVRTVPEIAIQNQETSHFDALDEIMDTSTQMWLESG